MRREAVEAQPVPAFEYPPHLLPVEIDSVSFSTHWTPRHDAFS